MRRTRGPRLAVAALALALLAGACSDGDAGTASAAAPAAITVEHARGTLQLDEVPERIVTLGLQWTDALLAVGVQPVGVEHDALAGDDGRFPWHDELASNVVGIDLAGGIPVEQVAALDPDLILVAPWWVEDGATYQTLAAVAPTVAGLSDRQVDRWQDQVTAVGTILGREDDAAGVIADVEGGLAAVAEELPGLDGKTFAMANNVAGDGIYVVADPDDGSSVFFRQLGMQLAPTVLDAAEGAASARPKFSFEQVSLLDADLLVIFSREGEAADLPGWENLPAVRSGAVAELDYVSVVGLNTPTPLGLSYSLEQVRPALEAASR